MKFTKKDSLFRTPLFRKTFLSLFTLALVIIVVFCALLSYSLQKSFRDEVAASSRYALERAGTAFENDLQWLAQDLGNMLWRSEFVDYMVLPSGRTLENETSIIQRLHSYTQNRLQIRELLFYAPLHGTFFSKDSSGVVDERYVPGLLKQAQQEVWSFWDDDRSTRTTVLQGTDFFLFTVELRLGQEPAGILYCVIDEQALFRLLNSADTGKEVYVLSGSLQSLLGSWAGSAGQAGTYSYTSEATGWTYLCKGETTALHDSVRAVLSTIIPIAVLFLLISAVFCYQISRWVYRPIEYLMDLVRREDSTPASDESSASVELACLDAATISEEYASISGTVRNVQPDVVPPLLRELSQGREIPSERVDEILSGVAAPFRSQGRFVLLACAIQEPQDRLVTETERNLYMLATQKLLAIVAEGTCFTLISSQPSRLLGLLAYPAQWEEGTIQSHLEHLDRAVRQASQSQPFSILLELSPEFHSLEQLCVQSAACQENLRSQIYDGQRSREVEELRRFSPAAKEFVQRTLTGEREPAVQAIQNVLTEVEEQCSGEPERFDSLTRNLLDAVIQQVAASNLVEEDRRWLLQTYAGRLDELKQLPSLQEKKRFLLDFTARLAGDLYQYGSKKHFQYIQSAKDFIAANYAQSSLSLNDVGESVGLSASYLSGLFKEYQKENFSAYLANYRVEQSKLLLTSTDLSVSSIGFACGFNSSQNYFRVFKKYTGITPGQYRSDHKGKVGV